MLRSGCLALLAMSGLVGCCGGVPEGSEQASHALSQIVPQARPVFAWFEAVKRGDREQLESVFSASMRARFEKQGWDEVMRGYQAVFEHDLGDYQLEAFAFEFTGGEKEGRVAVVYGGKKYGGLRVIREEAGWKVNER